MKNAQESSSDMICFQRYTPEKVQDNESSYLLMLMKTYKEGN